MRIIHDIDSFVPDWESSVLTPGVFDGLHLGHQALIERLQKRAQSKAPCILVTYEPHPDLVLGKAGRRPEELFTYQEKLALFQKFDLDVVVFLPFTLALARMTALRYLKDILLLKLRANHIIIGYDQCFGRGRKGDYQFLKMMSRRYPYQVERIKAVRKRGKIVSTSLVKQRLREGQIRQCNELLGHPFFITGTVVRGLQRGQTLGFPTANLQINATKMLPAHGVYAGVAEWGSERYRAMVNIGMNPTFDRNSLAVEAHLLDFQSNIYGEQLRINLVERIRDEMRFADARALKARLQQDLACTRKMSMKVQGLTYSSPP